MTRGDTQFPELSGSGRRDRHRKWAQVSSVLPLLLNPPNRRPPVPPPAPHSLHRSVEMGGGVGKVLWPFSAVTGVWGRGSGAGGTKFDLQPGPSGLVRPAAGRSRRGSREKEEEEEGASRAVSNGNRRPYRCPGRCQPHGGGVARRHPDREVAPSPLPAAGRVSAAPRALGASVNGRRASEAPRGCGQPPPARAGSWGGIAAWGRGGEPPRAAPGRPRAGERGAWGAAFEFTLQAPAPALWKGGPELAAVGSAGGGRSLGSVEALLTCEPISKNHASRAERVALTNFSLGRFLFLQLTALF